MTPQSAFMVVDTVAEGRLDDLRALLASMASGPGQANPDNALLPFALFPTLHVARFVVLEAPTANDITAFGWDPHPWHPKLAFLGDVDGDANAFLAELAIRAAPGLLEIFSHCENFATRRGSLLDWMLRHSVNASANYINWIGRTVIQIKEDVALHRSLESALPAIINVEGRDNPRAVRQRLLSHVEKEKHHGRLMLTPEQRTPRGWRWRNRLDWLCLPLVLLLLLPLLIVATPLVGWRLRHHEQRDPEIDRRPVPEAAAQLAEQEDIDVTNHFNVFGDVKPGMFRLMLLKFFLTLLGYASRHVYNRGFLTRVRSIHFARWVLMDNNRRLYFASNYDGSLESYMDDFINKVSWGLNLVFSHGIGYPSTRWIIKGGAEHEEPFKRTLRRHQLPSSVWYKAYPGLTAMDLANNARLREGITERPADDAAVREWLSLI